MQANDVSIWVARPAAFGAAQCDAMQRLLGDAERARAERLRDPADRRASVVAHALCRELIGQLLGQPAASLRFVRDAHGKPSVLATGRELFFSLSHTRGLVACAASFRGPLGLDVEAVEDARADADLLDLFIQPPAPGVVPTTGAAAFYTCWTGLEAYWKARGTGLSTANPRLRLVRRAGHLEATLDGDASEASRLFITPLDAAPGFAVALACGWVPTLQVVHWGPPAPERTQKCDKPSFIPRGVASLAALT